MNNYGNSIFLVDICDQSFKLEFDLDDRLFPNKICRYRLAVTPVRLVSFYIQSTKSFAQTSIDHNHDVCFIHL